MGAVAAAGLLLTLVAPRQHTWTPAVALRGRPAPVGRAARGCRGVPRWAEASPSEGQLPGVPEEANPWRENPKAALQAALERAQAEWAVLQAQAEVREHDGPLERAARASELLMTGALDRLRPFVVPAEYIDIPPLRGGEDALVALLGEDAPLVGNFLSQLGPLGPAGRAFWQAELYLRRIQETPGEAPVEKAAQEAGEQLDSEPAAREALRGSVLLARYNFVSAARFGYFLRRSRQRWQLERGIAGAGDVADDGQDDDGFLAALQRKAMAHAPPGAVAGGRWGRGTTRPRTLEDYLAALPAQQAVEIVRMATREASRALELRATLLFGSESELLAAFQRAGDLRGGAGGTGGVAQLQMSPEGRKRLAVEAAAFGAALFEAEEAASRAYALEYTAFGSRLEAPL